ncbi:uncharacterized protein KIAA0895-like isoform X2 [Acanthaster planci]|uniref:Uncharacterized protein KIAA0895-like isoform X2 n=1 Tax=Acanthaster planci TaxID=133434 RepID=A0A8B7YFR3_ACAPL|nr:uncharacterized protein KIAA0895-like isoform X2 [Acanthaster planci]
MGRRKKLRARAPSNGLLSVCTSVGDDEVEHLLREAPIVIHEQISLVSLRRTPSSKQDRRMTTPQNDLNVRESLTSSRHGQLPESTDSHHQELAVVQRLPFSDETLSHSASNSHLPTPNIKLPILSSSTHGYCKPAKPCRKNSRGSPQDTTANITSTRTKLRSTSRKESQGQKSSSKPAQRARSIPILAAITPDNVEQEKRKFFDSNFDYNPQFTYRSAPSAGILERYSKANDRLIKSATQIFRATLQRFKTYKQFEAATGGRAISVSQFTAKFQQYLAQEGLTNKVALNLSDSLVARALMSRTNGRPTLNARPNALRSQWSDGLLRHEIGTHYIRSANNREHPWNTMKGRKKYGLSPLNPTEEGIASIHSILLRKEPFLWRSAMLYYTTYMASRLSFADLFKDLETYMKDPEIRWDYCLRAKRGQSDTSKPGCFNKDQVYLEGALRVLRYRRDIDFHSLYKLGKVALEDVDHLKAMVNLGSGDLKIPTFMTDIDEYRKRLDCVVSKNGLDDADLALLFPGEVSSGKSFEPITGQVECPDLHEAGLVSLEDEVVE